VMLDKAKKYGAEYMLIDDGYDVDLEL